MVDSPLQQYIFLTFNVKNLQSIINSLGLDISNSEVTCLPLISTAHVNTGNWPRPTNNQNQIESERFSKICVAHAVFNILSLDMWQICKFCIFTIQMAGAASETMVTIYNKHM